MLDSASERVVSLARRFAPALAEALPRTPVERRTFAGRPFLAKREDLQETGSFKVRGALCRLADLDPFVARFGVVCASAGNHGKGVAWAAGRLGILATVVVPRETPEVKRRGIRDLGADLVVHDAPGYDAAEAFARRLAVERNALFLSPFDDPHVQAGNGGVLALELAEQAPEMERVIVPVGGGGLAGGLCATLAATRPLVEVEGAQSTASPAMARSLRDGVVHETWPPAETLAEGLEGGVAASSVALCRGRLAAIHEVSEASIAEAMIRARRELDVLLEGSAAVVLAAALEGKIALDARTVVVFTGRNVDPARLDALEAAEGRRV
ncbi:MAG TPA: pyridoxal-phosphate dependent enzyme [Planctomycetota bacterium]|nr:pyridoxal-phosphate dependent enzyme [Planctomycetota bacterium]